MHCGVARHFAARAAVKTILVDVLISIFNASICHREHRPVTSQFVCAWQRLTSFSLLKQLLWPLLLLLHEPLQQLALRVPTADYQQQLKFYPQPRCELTGADGRPHAWRWHVKLPLCHGRTNATLSHKSRHARAGCDPERFLYVSVYVRP